MRLVEFTNISTDITSALELQTPEDYHLVYNFIMTNCSDYLRIMQDTHSPLYRGMSSDINAFIGEINHRSKTNLGPRLTQIINNKIHELGLVANRTNSIFTSGNHWMASEYGSDTYAIFPFNTSKFTWSPSSADLNISIQDVFDTQDIDDILDEDLKEFLKRVKFNNNDFSKALKSGHEIYIHGKYVAIINSPRAERLGENKYSDFVEQIMTPNFNPKKAWPLSKSKINKNIITQITKDPYSIQYFPDASISEQLAAVSADGSAIQFIENPDVKVQLAAIKNDYTALSYIKNPNPQVIALAKKINNNAEYYTNKS